MVFVGSLTDQNIIDQTKARFHSGRIGGVNLEDDYTIKEGTVLIPKNDFLAVNTNDPQDTIVGRDAAGSENDANYVLVEGQCLYVRGTERTGSNDQFIWVKAIPIDCRSGS